MHCLPACCCKCASVCAARVSVCVCTCAFAFLESRCCWCCCCCLGTWRLRQRQQQQRLALSGAAELFCQPSWALASQALISFLIAVGIQLIVDAVAVWTHGRHNLQRSISNSILEHLSLSCCVALRSLLRSALALCSLVLCLVKVNCQVLAPGLAVALPPGCKHSWGGSRAVAHASRTQLETYLRTVQKVKRKYFSYAPWYGVECELTKV